MSEHDPLPVDLREIEARLASLVPAKAHLDRDRIMYAAGQAAAGAFPPADRSSPSSAGAWKRAACALAACVAIATTVAIHAYATRPRVVERIVYAYQLDEGSNGTAVATHDAPSSPPAGDAESPLVRRGSTPELSARTLWRSRDESDYLYQRNLVLRDGIDALPLPSSGAGEASAAPTVRELMDELLPSPSAKRTEAAT